METIFDKQDVRQLLEALNVQHDEQLIDRLAEGHESNLLEDVFVNNSYQDGKLRLFKDKNQILKFNFNPRYEKLTIPEKILDHKLTPDEKQDLENNKTILIKSNNTVIGLAVDKELNKVVVKGESQIGLLKELGGYNFSLKEQQALLNGEPVGPKVFYDEKEKRYIQASVAFTEDGKGIKFSGIKEVEKSKAQELINKYNLHQNEISSITNIASKSIQHAEKRAFDLHDFEIAIGNRDYQKLEVLKGKTEINNENLQHLFGSDSYKSLTRAEQIAVDKVLNSTPEQANEIATSGELETAKSAVNTLDIKAELKLNGEINGEFSAYYIGTDRDQNKYITSNPDPVNPANTTWEKISPAQLESLKQNLSESKLDKEFKTYNESQIQGNFTLSNDHKYTELTEAVRSKDYATLENMKISQPQLLQQVYQSKEYSSLTKEEQYGVQVALKASPREVDNAVISQQLNKALESNDIDKVKELADCKKLSGSHLDQIQDFVKSRGESLDPDVKESLGKTVESVKNDLSPNVKSISIPRSKSVGI